MPILGVPPKLRVCAGPFQEFRGLVKTQMDRKKVFAKPWGKQVSGYGHADGVTEGELVAASASECYGKVHSLGGDAFQTFRDRPEGFVHILRVVGGCLCLITAVARIIGHRRSPFCVVRGRPGAYGHAAATRPTEPRRSPWSVRRHRGLGAKWPLRASPDDQ